MYRRSCSCWTRGLIETQNTLPKPPETGAFLFLFLGDCVYNYYNGERISYGS